MNLTEDDKQALIQCSGCKKKFFTDGFKVTRLGKRLKTCLECNARGLANKHRHQERKNEGTIDQDHAKICKRDPVRIDTEVRKHGVRLVDPASYKNARWNGNASPVNTASPHNGSSSIHKTTPAGGISTRYLT